MKFVPKDQGNCSDNSSGGGTDGFLKETLLMILAHWAMMLSIAISIIAFFGLLILLNLWLDG